MRPGRMDDLPEALLALREEFLFRDPQRLARGGAFCAALLRQGRAFFHVTEDLSAPSGSDERILGASIHVFVTAEFAGQLRSGHYPFAILQMADLAERGELPVLSAQEIREANTPVSPPSLTMFVFAGLLPRFMRTDAGIAIREQGSAFAAYSASGYNLAEFLMEAHGPDWLARSQLQGMAIRTDNTPGLAAANLPAGVPQTLLTEAACRPYLVGVTKSEAINPGGGAMARLFSYVPPCCRFAPAEQDLLLYALSGMTDEDLARHLRLSPATVRKRWRGIYDRMFEALPGLLPGSADSRARLNEAVPPGRSLEKKRRLLNYLRTHLEELRPAALPDNALS